ncbi:MAG: hypothetical protein H6744_03105 [Deltaproteobacteria bacterium]|nr:hypothetical protein [Deltaproteobacteria bacterium]MCB9785663.1 hypothetical protein [Deltaproteobacteria bacterium]
MRALLLMLALALVSPAALAKTRSRGSVGLEGRAFWGFWENDRPTEDLGLALEARVELAWDEDIWSARARVFGRVGALDLDRSILAPEELYLGISTDRVRVRVGALLFNWSATEAFHPADVLNSRNFDSNLENAEKLGEPMAWLEGHLWEGARFEAMFMPARIDPRLPGPRSRLAFIPSSFDLGGTPVALTLGDPLWTDRDGHVGSGHFAPQWGARISQVVGDADISLQAVRHSDRSQPVFVATDDALRQLGSTGSLELRPLYSFVTHVGLTYTQVVGDWVLKLEAAYRHFRRTDTTGLARTGIFPLQQRDHLEIAGGLEYGWLWPGTDAEGTLLLEGQGYVYPDGRGDQFESPFESDILIGYRHAFNDLAGRELLFTLITDVTTGPELLINLSYSQRISDVWSIAAALRVAHAPAPAGAIPEGLQVLDGDHQLRLTLTRHF